MSDLSRRLQQTEDGYLTYQGMLREFKLGGSINIPYAEEIADYIDKLEGLVVLLPSDEVKALIIAITFVLGSCDPNKIPPDIHQTLQSFTDDLRRLLE